MTDAKFQELIELAKTNVVLRSLLASTDLADLTDEEFLYEALVAFVKEYNVLTDELKDIRRH